MIRIAALMAVFLSLSACGGSHPALPAATAFTLSGTVFGDGTALPGASVAIMDGVHAGQARVTDSAGRYSFTNLMPSSFTLRATATGGYGAQNQSVNLTTSDKLVNFQLFDH
jgi:carboxypeptidase family protein